MASNRAIINEAKGQANVATVGVPKLRDDYIIVNVKAVALNPTDWKHVDFLPVPGRRIGCESTTDLKPDYAGVVEEVGRKVTKDLKKGDRVAGFVHGGNQVQPEDGAFGEYITAKGDLQIKIPENLSFEEASTLGVGITTVGQALYQSLKLPLPGEPPVDKIPILIYGGSTATGTLAIQYAKLSGATVIATCSPHNFDFLKGLGADAVFDYKSSTCSDDIRAFAKDDLSLVLDCIGGEEPAKISAAAMSPAGGTFSTILQPKRDLMASINPKVKVNSTVAYTVVGEYYLWGQSENQAKPEDFEFGKMFWELSRGLLESGRVKVHRPAVNKYGASFDGILKGLDAMRQGKVSGEKLVFTL